MVKQKVAFKSLNDCVEITDGKTRAIVSVSFGPRVLFYGKVGGENLLAELSQKAEQKDLFEPYGGHRVWLSPEIEGRTNIADNLACKCSMDKDSVTVTSPVSKTLLETGIKLRFGSDGALTVTNFVVNRGAFPIEGAVWGITQLRTGGILVAPFPKRDTGLMSNRTISLWQYSDMTDPRVAFKKKMLFIRADEAIAAPFKTGFNVEGGRAYYFTDRLCFVKSFDYDEKASYPNGNANFECYVCGKFIESEALAPLKLILPQEKHEYSERWNIADCQPLEDFDEASALKAMQDADGSLAEA